VPAIGEKSWLFPKELPSWQRKPTAGGGRCVGKWYREGCLRPASSESIPELQSLPSFP